MLRDVFSKCSICGRRIRLFEERYYIKDPKVPKDLTFWACKECRELKGVLIFPSDGSIKYKHPDGTISDTATSSYEKRKTPKFSWRIDWFRLLFSLSTAIIGFFIMNNKIGGKIGGAVLFMVMGWITACILDFLIKHIRSKSITVVLKIILCILIGLSIFKIDFVEYHAPRQKYYDKYGKSYYSEEARDEANFNYEMYEAVYNNK